MKKIDRGQIRFREYSITLLQPDLVLIQFETHQSLQSVQILLQGQCTYRLRFFDVD